MISECCRQQLGEILDAANLGITVIDRDGIVRLFNQTAATLLHLQAHEVVGRFGGEIFPSTWEEIAVLFDTGEPQLGRRVHINGVEIITSRTPIRRSGDIVGAVSIFQEFSSYEKALTELDSYQELNELLDTIIDSSFDGIWVCDSEGRVLRVSRDAARREGVNPERFVGRKMPELVAEGYVDRSVTLEVLKKKTRVSLVQSTESGLRYLVTGTPVFDREGNIKLVIVNEREISFLSKWREELEESRALAREYRSELSQLNAQEIIGKEMVARSAEMEKVLSRALKAGRVDSTILIQGESGVGKSLLARMIHESSNRKAGPFVRVDCGSIPPSLMESELFGYEKGAFTGAADKGKPGRFELAAGGTLFLDEIGELPLEAQAKILRFLEDGELYRVGGTKERKIDVRIIAATNRNLEELVKEKKFRKDLYYRLNVIPITIPPLRERPGDLPALIFHFLKHYNEKYGITRSLDAPAVDCLLSYRFPGNVRELANLMEQAVTSEKDLDSALAIIEAQTNCRPTYSWVSQEAPAVVLISTAGDAEVLVLRLLEAGFIRVFGLDAMSRTPEGAQGSRDEAMDGDR